MKRLLCFCLGLVGVTLQGCVEEYGPLYTEYRYDFGASGRVVDSKGEPINGIKVSTRGESTTTSSNGRFYVEGAKHDITSILFDDVDGKDNGGEFVSRNIEFDFDDNTYSDLGDVVLLRQGEEESSDEE